MPPHNFCLDVWKLYNVLKNTWGERETHSFFAKYMRYYILTREKRLRDAVQREVSSPQSDGLLCCDTTVCRRSNSALCCTWRQPHNTLQKPSAHCQSFTRHFLLYDYFIIIILIDKYIGDQALTLCFDTPLYLCINRNQKVLNIIVLYCKLSKQTVTLNVVLL